MSLQMTPRSTLSNAFWKSTNTEYSGVCHSSDCSMIIRSVAMWSVQDLSWRKPACPSRRVSSRAFLSLSRMILDRILLGMESSMITRQLLHDDRSSFFGSFTRYPFFHSSGICSFSQIWFFYLSLLCSLERFQLSVIYKTKTNPVTYQLGYPANLKPKPK